MEDITDSDYTNAKSFKINNSDEYHDLNVHSDPLLLVNLFELFINMCHEMYDSDPALFLQHLD